MTAIRHTLVPLAMFNALCRKAEMLRLCARVGYTPPGALQP